MLNKEARNKADMLSKIVSVSKDASVFPKLTAYDIEWLANTVIWMDDRYKEHKNCCINKCTYKEA